MTLAPLDELRALPPPLARAVLERVAREHGPAAVAALRWQIEAHRRPSQRLVGIDQLCDDGQPWRVLVVTGEYGSGKTQLATWLTLRAIVEWRVERPRIIAANADTVGEDLVNEDAPSGLLAWLPPWVSREWLPSAGRAGRLTIDGVAVSLLSADAGANAIGSAAGWVFFDDYAKCVQVLGAARAEAALAAAFKSLRAFPGRMILPTTHDGAEMIATLASSEGMRGVVKLDLGRTEDNLALPPAALDFAAGLRRMNLWSADATGAFAHVKWPTLRMDQPPPLKRAIVFVDPAKSQRSHACKVGIVASGIDHRATVYGLADRSDQRTPDGPQGWPSATHELAEDVERRFGLPKDSVELGIETNTLGEHGVEILRQEERLRRSARGEQPISIRKIHKVTSKPNDPKTRRAGPIVAMAEGGQLRMLPNMGNVERSLSNLKDGGTKSDEGDALVHGARILAGLGEGDKPDPAEATRAAFVGLVEAQTEIREAVFDLDVA